MSRVLSEFFTNGAVAVFTIGVLAPVYAKPVGLEFILPGFLSAAVTVACLFTAGYFEDRK